MTRAELSECVNQNEKLYKCKGHPLFGRTLRQPSAMVRSYRCRKKLFLQYATEVGLDVEKLKLDKNNPAIKDKIQKDIDSDNKLQISGTPTIFMNGKEVNFPDTPQKFFEMVQEEKRAVIEAKLNK